MASAKPIAHLRGAAEQNSRLDRVRALLLGVLYTRPLRFELVIYLVIVHTLIVPRASVIRATVGLRLPRGIYH